MGLYYRVGWAAAIVLAITLMPRPATAGDNLETSGDIIQILLPAGAYGMTWLKADPQGRRSFAASFATTLGITYGLKLGVNKERPNGGEMAFPSGHTSAAFSGAAFIAQRYGWGLGLPACLAALVVGHSRIMAEKHDPEDVFAGALIGVLPAVWFTPGAFEGVALCPVLDHQRLGLVWAVAW